jgi:NAD(P)-dependent dehydrogenase (short-subunit alcohol dehydrogenase family)
VTSIPQALDHFARVLAEAGASVILAGRQVDKMEALQDELRKQARDCSVLVFDAQRCASIEALGPAIQDVDILVNNAGVARPSTGAADRSSTSRRSPAFATEMTAGFWDSEEGKAMLQRIPQRRLAVCKTWTHRFCCWPPRPRPT